MPKPFPISITPAHDPLVEVVIYQEQTEKAAIDGNVIVGNWKYCPLAVSELKPVLPVCVNKAALQHVPPVHGPALCTVGAVVEAVSWPRGLGELSASILPASNA